MKVLGFDIGGANTKATFVKATNGRVEKLRTELVYFPIWKRSREALGDVLEMLANRLAMEEPLDCVAVTMTAELSDAYQTKREGVNHVLDCVATQFPDRLVQVLTVDAQLISVEEARKKPLLVASANWAATGWMAARLFRNCIVVDTGSTSTSIIPIVDGRIAAMGKNDMEKLANGELVYTGALRTNVAAIVSHVPVKGRKTRVSSELFAQSGDVHLLLSHIGEEQYYVDTADGRGKSRLEAMARLARVVCADIEMLGQEEIMEMARYIYRRQVQQIAQALRQVYLRIKPHVEGDVPVAVAGIGRKFLAMEAAKQIGLRSIVDLADWLGPEAAAMTPSAAVALMALTRLGEDVQWMLL